MSGDVRDVDSPNVGKRSRKPERISPAIVNRGEMNPPVTPLRPRPPPLPSSQLLAMPGDSRVADSSNVGKRKRQSDNMSNAIVNREDIAAEKVHQLIRSAGANEESLKTCLDYPSYDTEFFLRLSEKLGLDISTVASAKRAKVLKTLITKILENN
jgi:hypothetical protein